MKVKVIRKGYCKGLRNEGEVFEFDGKDCPSWCEEVKQTRRKLVKKDKE